MARRKAAAPDRPLLTCGFCSNGFHDRCASVKHALFCACHHVHKHKEA